MAANTVNRLDALYQADPDGLKPEVMKEIAMIEPEKSVFLTLMEAAGEAEKSGQMFFKHPRQFPFERVLHAAAANSSTTTLTITNNYLYLVAGSAIMNARTREIMRVDTSPSTSSVTVTRGYATTPGAAILVDDDLIILATHIDEGGNIPDAVQRATEHLTNYIGHVGRTIDITDIMETAERWGIPEESRIIDQQLSEWNKDRNFQLMYGQPKYDATGNLKSMSAGLDYYTSKYNSYDCGGSFTYDKLVELVMELRKSTGVKNLALLAPTMVIRSIAKWHKTEFASRSKMQDKTLGVDATEITIPGGCNVHVIYDLATEIGANTVDGKYKAYLVNMEDVKIVRHGKNTEIIRGTKERGAYKTSRTVDDKFGLLLRKPESHGELKNIQFAA